VTRPILFGSLEGKEDVVRAAAVALHTELALWNERVGPAGWLYGDAISAADVANYPSIQTRHRGASRPKAAPLALDLLPLAPRYPRIAAWCAKIEALPGYEATYPPHWRE